MNLLTKLTVLGALAASSSSFAAPDCRAIFDSGYSEEVKALLGSKFELVDEDKIENPAEIPYRIIISDDVDVDPEMLTFKVTFFGTTLIEEKREAGDFKENVEWATTKLKTIPSCTDLYHPHPRR
jgi:hypothetical protein